MDLAKFYYRDAEENQLRLALSPALSPRRGGNVARRG
jgi:hypothetical protein